MKRQSGENKTKKNVKEKLNNKKKKIYFAKMLKGGTMMMAKQ